MLIHAARQGESTAIADIWRAGWIDGHVGHVPEALVAARTAEWFAVRAGQNLAATTVAVIGGSVAGFVTVARAEVEQVYVAEGYRGAGVAAALLDTAEQQIADAGHEVAW